MKLQIFFRIEVSYIQELEGGSPGNRRNVFRSSFARPSQLHHCGKSFLEIPAKSFLEIPGKKFGKNVITKVASLFFFFFFF